MKISNFWRTVSLVALLSLVSALTQIGVSAAPPGQSDPPRVQKTLHEGAAAATALLPDWAQPAPLAQELPLRALAAAAPEGTGIKDIGNSTLANVTPQPLPIGSAFDMCFTVFVQSPAAEYLDHFEVDLPDNWTVNSVAPDSVPPANGCSGALPPVVGVGVGNVVYWQSKTYPPQTSCGAWNGGSAGANFDFCANVTIPDPSGAPWMLPWTYIGDGWGSAPHQVSGSYGPVQALQPDVFLDPDQLYVEGCAYEPQQHILSLWNNTGYDTDVNLTYNITSGSGRCQGPALVFVPNGATVDISVALRAAGTPGGTVVCQVYAQDGSNSSYNDTSLIIKTLIARYFDPAGWQTEPITNATPHQWAGGAVGGNPAAAGPVGYVVGGLDSTAALNPDLQMYDPGSGSWTQLADMPNPRFSPVVGWINGLLYAAGGHNAAFSATNDLQVYNPATDSWDNTTYTDMPNSRGGGAGGVGICSSGVGECLFHVGGGLDSSFANTTLETWQYDPAANAWTQLDNKPAGSSPSGFVLGAGVGCMGHIYVGGDYRGYHEFYRLDATQPAGSQWTQLANIPANAGAMTPALVCKEDWGKIVLIGGDPDGYWGTYNNTVYVYDIASDTWDGPLPQTLNVGQLGSVGWHIGNRVWTSGGTVGSYAITPMPFESLAQIICRPPTIYVPLVCR